MKLRLVAYLMFTSLISAGCAGIPLPFTDYRLANWLVEIKRQEVNSTCIDLATLNSAALDLEDQHLVYLRTHDEANAIVAGNLIAALGEECQTGFSNLSVPEIKTELFGDIQTISDSSGLRELGGLSFRYGDVATKGGIEVSFHMNKASKGPSRRMVAIYRLEDGKVIHFNYSGTNNVDKKTRTWPLDEIFGIAVRAVGKVAVP